MILREPGIPRTAEVDRILRIPRRTVPPELAAQWAEQATAMWRTPNGTMRLRPVQGQALAELHHYRGLFGPIRVGGGKTLISLLAPLAVNAKRPLLLLPAKLAEKTRRERAELSQHWRIPRYLRIESYDKLSRAQHEHMLTQLMPDLIICDEAHRLKNLDAALTRRFARYMAARRDTICVMLSGTMTKKELLDYYHLLVWSLRPENTPIPHDQGERLDWNEALSGDSLLTRPHPGAILDLATPDEYLQAQRNAASSEEREIITVARTAFRRRLLETPGVVATNETPIDASLIVDSWSLPTDAAINEAFERLRCEWTLPDGWPLSDAMQVWRHAREMALGFVYVWDPRPPDEWLEVRSVYARWVRSVLERRAPGLDSELQVCQRFPQDPRLVAWREIKNTFEKNQRPHWISGVVVYAIADRLKHAKPTIVWVEHTAFGQALADVTGFRFYAEQGLTRDGHSIEVVAREKPQTIIASIHSNSEGRNLQAWHRNLYVGPPYGGLTAEQSLGRTHRDGQTADTVYATFAVGCIEHEAGIWAALNQARYTEETQGVPQKLLLADRLIASSHGAECGGIDWRFEKIEAG